MRAVTPLLAALAVCSLISCSKDHPTVPTDLLVFSELVDDTGSGGGDGSGPGGGTRSSDEFWVRALTSGPSGQVEHETCSSFGGTGSTWVNWDTLSVSIDLHGKDPTAICWVKPYNGGWVRTTIFDGTGTYFKQLWDIQADYQKMHIADLPSGGYARMQAFPNEAVTGYSCTFVQWRVDGASRYGSTIYHYSGDGNLDHVAIFQCLEESPPDGGQDPPPIPN